MLGQPFRGIVLAPHQARLQRQILDWTLLGAGGRRTLQTEDEDKRGQWIFLSRDGSRKRFAGVTIPFTWESVSSCSHLWEDLPTPRATTIRLLRVPIT